MLQNLSLHEAPKLPAVCTGAGHYKDFGRNGGCGAKRKKKIPLGEVTALQRENQVLSGAECHKDGHIKPQMQIPHKFMKINPPDKKNPT